MKYICNCCKVTKEQTEFAQSDNIRGYRYECKQCYNARRKGDVYKTKFNKYERARYQTPEGRWTYMLKGVRDRAKRKGRECDLTLEYIQQLYEAQGRVCAKTKREFVFETTGVSGYVNKNAPSIDRIDSNRGYVKDNVQIVTYQYNVAKSHNTEDDLIQLAKDILNADNSTP